MASPQATKTSFYPEAGIGIENTTNAGVAIKVDSDGAWRPQTSVKEAMEQYAGAEAPLAGAVVTVTNYWEGKYRKGLRTHGDEAWWRGCVGTSGGVTPVVPAGNPPLFDKVWRTHRRGPDLSRTVVQDRSIYGNVPTGIYQQVFRGVKVKGWDVLVTVGQPVLVGQTLVAQQARTHGGAQPDGADYPVSPSGTTVPRVYGWQNTSLRVGPPGTVGVNIGFLTSFRYQQDNKLDLKRTYTSGTVNLADPESKEPNFGSVNLQFDYAAVVDTWLIDRFGSSTDLSLELTCQRGDYRWRLWIPNVHLSIAVPNTTLGRDTTVTAAGMLRWDSSSGEPAVTVTARTEGNTQ